MPFDPTATVATFRDGKPARWQDFGERQNEVAAHLIDYAREHAPSQVGAVEADAERFFADLETPTVRERDFLAEAKRGLPRDLYREVERAYRGAAGRRPTSIAAAE